MSILKKILFAFFIILNSDLIIAEDLISYPKSSNTESKDTCTRNICEPKFIYVNENTLEIQGQALYRYFIFNIYVATFYSENPIKNLDTIYETPGDKFLRLVYLRSIDAEDFISSSKKALKEIPYAETNLIGYELNQLYSSYEDIEKGESYSLYYSDKNKLTCLFKNDVRKTCIKGDAFYKAYFSIWLSNYSLDNEFSKKLINK